MLPHFSQSQVESACKIKYAGDKNTTLQQILFCILDTMALEFENEFIYFYFKFKLLNFTTCI